MYGDIIEMHIYLKKIADLLCHSMAFGQKLYDYYIP